MRKVCVGAFALVLAAGAAMGAPISPGNVVIYRVGTGSGNLVNTGNAVFIDEYTPAGLFVQSIAMPTATSGANRQLIASGTATSEGLLTVSPDGQYIAVTGYGRNLGGSGSLSGTAAGTVNRTVGIVTTSTGAVNTSTALADFADANNPRSAYTTDGTSIWLAGGAGGARYTTVGSSSSTQLASSPTNLRQITVADGQLYTTSGSGSFRLATVGTGLPTTSGQTIANLPGAVSALTSPYAVFFADLSPSVPGVDTVYVADDGASALSKYSLVSGSWVLNGTVGVAADAYRGVTGVADASGVHLFATRKGGSGATGGGELVALDDLSGYNGAFAGSPTLLATAGANTAFRGVGYIVPTPGSLALLAIGGIMSARRRR